jgi:hypothetical protein
MAWEIDFQTRGDNLTTVEKMTSNSRSNPIQEKKATNFRPQVEKTFNRWNKGSKPPENYLPTR